MFFILIIFFLYRWIKRLIYGPEPPRVRGLREFPSLPPHQPDEERFFDRWQRLAQSYPPGSLRSVDQSVSAFREAVRTLKLQGPDMVRRRTTTTTTTSSPSVSPIFEAHRLGGHMLDTSLASRISVHYNLFCGSVANLGSSAQQLWLQDVLDKAEMGCFALAEERAGVLSGLIVDTLCKVVKEEQGGGGGGHTFFLELDSGAGGEGARKVWITNAMSARWAVVVARLILSDGSDKGPHAFIVDMQSKGVRREDGPRKVAFSSLDMGTVSFDRVRLPVSQMLSGASYIDENGHYVQRDPNRPHNFMHVLQRLLAGRICMSGASLAMVRDVVERTHAYAMQRHIPTVTAAKKKEGEEEDKRVASSTPLAKMPFLSDAFERIQNRWLQLSRFVEGLEMRYSAEEEITVELANSVACAKIECNRFALETIAELKEKIGAFCLLDESPFGPREDYETALYCQRFAEGSSAILEQKMARDCIRHYAGKPWLMLADIGALIPALIKKKKNAWLRIQTVLAQVGLGIHMVQEGGLRPSQEKTMQVWLDAHEKVEKLARLKCQLTIADAI